MMIPPRIQRVAAIVWPVTVLILAPVIALEAYNLWRKNRVNCQRATAIQER